MLTNFRKNCLGTTCFDAQFKGMRKAQDFDVYPLSGTEVVQILVQSETRIGYINLKTGVVKMTKGFPGGAFNRHLAMATDIDKLNEEELFTLKTHIFASASGKAGNRGVYVDNSAAIEVFTS